jgi:hypothetical protein
MARIVTVFHDDTTYQLSYYTSEGGDPDQLAIVGDGQDIAIIGTLDPIDVDQIDSDMQEIMNSDPEFGILRAKLL